MLYNIPIFKYIYSQVVDWEPIVHNLFISFIIFPKNLLRSPFFIATPSPRTNPYIQPWTYYTGAVLGSKHESSVATADIIADSCLNSPSKNIIYYMRRYVRQKSACCRISWSEQRSSIKYSMVFDYCYGRSRAAIWGFCQQNDIVFFFSGKKNGPGLRTKCTLCVGSVLNHTAVGFVFKYYIIIYSIVIRVIFHSQ